MKTIQPTENYLFCEKQDNSKTESGILVTKPKVSNQATVINVGKQCKDIKSKDTVMFIPTPHSQDIELDGKKYLLLHKDHVLGVIKEV